jgi:hypothetical protein
MFVRVFLYNAVLGVLAFTLASVLPVAAEVVYFNDFEGTVGSEWSNTLTDTTPVGDRKFLGQFGNDTVSLTLTDLPPHTNMTVTFDLFIIQSWDGNNIGYGPDIWELSVAGGPTLLYTTFSNAFASETDFRQAYPDSYPGGDNPGLTGAAESDTLGYPDTSGYDGANDSVYRLSFSFPHSESSLTLNFASNSDGPGYGESWGLDNVTVQVVEASAEINGHVTDPAGNPLSEAWVIATNIDTQEKRRVKTDGDGFYVISDLDPGTYRLVCIKRGYKLAPPEKVEALPNEKTTVDFVLELK